MKRKGRGGRQWKEKDDKVEEKYEKRNEQKGKAKKIQKRNIRIHILQCNLEGTKQPVDLSPLPSLESLVMAALIYMRHTYSKRFS